MCTLTWSITADGYFLAFNRDEALQLAPALPPQMSSLPGGAQVAFPVDPQGGGTWIAANDAGVSLCLLNDYASTARRKRAGLPPVVAPDGHVSPGLLVKELCAVRSLFELLQALGRVSMEKYRPFILVAFERRREPQAFVWDGEQLEQRLAPRCPVTSSVFSALEVEEHRRSLFAATFKPSEEPEPERLLAFHRTRESGREAWSVAMKREGSADFPEYPDGFATLSLTTIEVGRDHSVLRYFPGDPAISTEPAVDLRLPLCSPEDEDPRELSLSAPPRAFQLGQIFEEKNPKLHRKIPSWGFSLLAHTVAVERFNEGLCEIGDPSPRRFAERVLDYLGVEVQVRAAPSLGGGDSASRPQLFSHRGLLNTVSSGQCEQALPPIFVANHPMGGLDGLAMVSFLLSWFGDVVAPVNDVLLGIPYLRPYCLPIDKSRTRRNLADSIEAAFARPAPVLLFPSGRTARMENGSLSDGEWGRMVVRRALRQNRAVVPVFIEGRNSDRFYRVSRIRKALGIGANLEMFLLLRELLDPPLSQMRLHVGEALSSETLRSWGDTDEFRVAELRARCYGLDPRQPAPAACPGSVDLSTGAAP